MTRFTPILRTAGALLLPLGVPIFCPAGEAGGISDVFRIIPAEWATLLPPSGAVSFPGTIKALSPDQEFAIGVVATGPDRARMLASCKMKVTIQTADSESEQKDIELTTIRPVREPGAPASDVVALAVFPVDWVTPPVRRTGQIRIKVALKSKQARTPSFEPVIVAVRSWSDWANEPDWPKERLESFLTRFHEDFQPGTLLPALRSAVRIGALRSAAATEYFAVQYASHPAARDAGLEMLEAMDARTRYSFLLTLRSGGQKVGGYARTLPAPARAALDQVGVLPDPRAGLELKEPVTEQSVHDASVALDECWGAWMATGDPGYLRAVAGLLGAAPDYPDFEGFAKAKPADRSFNRRVARGLLYKEAGWSLASFDRTDPRVAEWIRSWRADPAFPVYLRRELEALHTRAAFQSR